MTAPRHPLYHWQAYRAILSFAFEHTLPRPSRHHRARRHHELSAWLIQRGEIELESDGDRTVAKPGQWLVCSGTDIFQLISSDTYILSLRIQLRWPFGSFLKGSSVQVLEAADFPALERIARELLAQLPEVNFERSIQIQMLWESRLNYQEFLLYRQRFDLWMSELALALTASGRELHYPISVDSRLHDALQLLENHPLSAPFPREALERIGGIQLTRLNQLCTDAFGFTLHAAWDKRRYQQALDFLSLPYLTIKEIAFNLGFSRLSHFSHWFRTHCGVSPRAYRQKRLTESWPDFE